MENFITVYAIVFGVLQTVLFFKIWGMTNDVAKLTKHFCVLAPDTDGQTGKSPDKRSLPIGAYMGL